MRPGATIYVVDDDAAVLKAIGRVLRADGWQVKTFDSAETFLAEWEPTSSGCLVLDVNLPGLDGLALQRQLQEMGDSLPIIFLTGHGDIPMSVRAIKAGAADFLTKPVEAAALSKAIRVAIDQNVVRREFHAEASALRQRLRSLTPRELAVLKGLAEGKLNKQIAFELGVVEQTVKFHRARIMLRLQAKSVAELMLMVARAES